MHSWWLSWKHLVHKPATLTLNLVLLALSTGLIAAVMLFNHMLTDRLDRNLAGVDMVIGAKGSPLQLILAGMYHIDVPTGNISLREAGNFLREDHPLIALSVPLSLGDSYKGFRIIGTDQRFLELYQLRVAEGQTFQQPMEVLAGAQVARVLGLKIGDTFQSVHGLDDNEDLTHEDSHPFRISGILEPSGSVADQLLLCSNASVWMVHDDHDHDHDTSHDQDHAHSHDHDHNNCNHADHNHAVHDHGDPTHADHDHGDHDYAPEVPADEREITSVLVRFKVRNHLTLNLPRNINENTNLQAASPAMELNRLYSLLGSGAAMLRTLALVIMIVAGLSIFVSLYSSLQARRYELALLRVMGSSPYGLFRLIMQEGMALALLGGVLGLLLAHTGVWLAGIFLEQEWRYQFDPWFFLPEEGLLLLAVLAFGLLASLLPAWQARKVDIADTLTRG
jgi:putative ABC transport system permease protein